MVKSLTYHISSTMKTAPDEQRVRTATGTTISRSHKYGVGKEMGQHLYVHRTCEDVIPQERLAAAKKCLPKNADYTIVKYDSKAGSVSFIQSPDFDANPEPIVTDAWSVKRDGSVTLTKGQSDPWIYHHKWTMVQPDYKGFDTSASVERSRQWTSLDGIDYSRIGKKSFWEKNVLPRMSSNKKGGRFAANLSAHQNGVQQKKLPGKKSTKDV